MRKITVLCVGRLKEKFYIDAAAEYVKRLSRFCDLKILEIPESRPPVHPSPAQIETALLKESVILKSKFPADAYIISLCIEGKALSSVDFAAKLLETSARPLLFIIGGSYGLHESIKNLSDLKLSMSNMTFPHHLARVMALEQIYRACQINSGGEYHK